MSKAYNQRQPNKNGDLETIEFANRRKKNRKLRKLVKWAKRKNRK